jgi:hypothetical protein
MTKRILPGLAGLEADSTQFAISERNIDAYIALVKEKSGQDITRDDAQEQLNRLLTMFERFRTWAHKKKLEGELE